MIQQNNDQTWFQQYQHQQAPPPQQIKHDAAYNPDAAIDDGGGGWLDSAPGVAMEYKVHVDAAKEDCYWQYVHKGATFYMSSQVLKGNCHLPAIVIRKKRFCIDSADHGEDERCSILVVHFSSQVATAT